MDKKTKKVKPIKPRKFQKTKTSLDYSNAHRSMNIEGVDNIILSSITQKILGCIVGENITNENPWIYVNKEAIEDNLELHELSSEFLPVKDFIKAYPEDKILIGTDCSINVTPEPEERAFYICTTVAAKETIIKVLESEKKNCQEQLRTKVEKISRSWISLGSEIEVDQLIVKDLRPQLQVEIVSSFPLHKNKKNFKLHYAEDMRSGYVELLPGRFSINNIFRKRVDVSVQVAPHFVTEGCQIGDEVSKNRRTQYEFTYQALDYADFVEDMSLFVRTMIKEITYLLVFNFDFNLYSDDYSFLKTTEITNFSYNLENIVSFKDVFTCKDTKVSALTWHPLISGIIAAAYRLYPENLIHKEEIQLTQEELQKDHIVLIWCENDPINVKIKLESPSEVNCLEFCPFNYEYLIGGCTNGQIVIWDLTNKLQQLETTEILTHSEQKHRSIINERMKWMKLPGDVNCMRPTIVSNVGTSHSGTVTAISWIRPDCFIDIIGHVHTSPTISSLQFLTSARDNRIFLWDLHQRPRWEEKKSKKKKTSLPINSNEYISSIRPLNHQFAPKYKIILGTGKLYLPITCMVLDSYKYQYRPINDTKLVDAKRTYFEQIQPAIDTTEEFKPNFLVTTSLGGVVTGSWQGLSFNQGVACHQECCELNPIVTVHDGPVVICRLNAYYPQYFLTVGGKVFAVWDRNRMKRPVYWRKSRTQYISGAWVPNDPFAIILARSDLAFEHCTILTSGSSSKIEIRSKDACVLGMHIENGKQHVLKNRIAISNTIGAIRINKFPELSEIQKNVLLKKSNNLLKTLNKLEVISSKNQNLRKISLKKPQPDHDQLQKESNINMDVTNILFRTAFNWDKLEYIFTTKNIKSDEFQIYDVILKKKQINLSDLIKQKGPLKEKLQNEMATEIKFRQILANKPKIFQNALNSLIVKIEYKRKNKIFITPSDKKTISAMKHSYLSNYKELEEESLNKIKRRSRKTVSFSWNGIIAKGKAKKSINSE